MSGAPGTARLRTVERKHAGRPRGQCCAAMGETGRVRSDDMCSHCLLPWSTVGPLLHSPLATICRDCAERALARFDADGVSGADDPRRLEPQWQNVDDDALLRRIADIAGARDGVEENLAQWVGRARERGITWARIGVTLGMTRQSAWERFRRGE